MSIFCALSRSASKHHLREVPGDVGVGVAVGHDGHVGDGGGDDDEGGGDDDDGGDEGLPPPPVISF